MHNNSGFALVVSGHNLTHAGHSQSAKVGRNPTVKLASVQETVSSSNADAIIIGAGISGLYQLIRLRELGMKLRVF